MTLVYCGQTVGWIKMKLGKQVGLGPGQIVLDGDPAPLPKKGAQPPISVHVYCGQTAGCIKISRCHLVRRQSSAQATLCYMGNQLRPKRGRGFQFSAHIYCSQTVAELLLV